jgi:hypothetical protein
VQLHADLALSLFGDGMKSFFPFYLLKAQKKENFFLFTHEEEREKFPFCWLCSLCGEEIIKLVF